MIDSMLDDDSPVSCDPAHSRDVYQVAIDELTNGGQTGSFNRDDIAAAARAVSGSQAAPAGSTAAFVALVANAAANNAYSATSRTRTLLPTIRTLMKPWPRTRRPLPPAVPPKAHCGALLPSSRRPSCAVQCKPRQHAYHLRCRGHRSR